LYITNKNITEFYTSNIRTCCRKIKFIKLIDVCESIKHHNNSQLSRDSSVGQVFCEKLYAIRWDDLKAFWIDNNHCEYYRIMRFILQLCDILCDWRNALTVILVYCQRHELTLDYDHVYRQQWITETYVFHEKCKRDNYFATPNNPTLIRIIKSGKYMTTSIVLIFDWIIILYSSKGNITRLYWDFTI
jgi:hypothetical protein